MLLYVKMKFMFVHKALGTNYRSSSPTRAPKQTIAQDSRTPFPTARTTCSFKDRESLWDNMINSATGLFTTQEGYDMVSQLYVQHQGEFGTAEHIIEKSLKNIKEETKWSDENLPVIEQWLDHFLASNGVADQKFLG